MHERKRHTDRGVPSTPSAVLSREGGTPSLAGAGGYPTIGYPPSWPGQGGTPIMRYRLSSPGPSHWGTPPGKDMGPVEVLWDGDEDGVPRVWTDWKHNFQSRTTYAVGKKKVAVKVASILFLVQSRKRKALESSGLHGKFTRPYWILWTETSCALTNGYLALTTTLSVSFNNSLLYW